MPSTEWKGLDTLCRQHDESGVEDDARGQWPHQMNSHDFLWSLFILQQGNTSYEGSEDSLRQFSWVTCTYSSTPNPSPQGSFIPCFHHSWALHPWSLYCLLPSFPTSQSQPQALLQSKEVQVNGLVTSSAPCSGLK